MVTLKEYTIFKWGEIATINNYPYGFNKRCTLKAWIENNKNGSRLTTQTIFNEVANKPKSSTYGQEDTFLITKDGFLYQAVISEDFKTLAINRYAGKGEVIILDLDEQTTSLIPEDTLKAFKRKMNIRTALNNHYGNSREQRQELLKSLTDEQIKERILNASAWVIGGGGYYFKNGFYKHEGGLNYANNTKIKPSVSVALCVCLENTNFILFTNSFNVEIEENQNLTPKLKAECETKAREQLKEWLKQLKEGEYKEGDLININREDSIKIAIGNTTQL